MIILFLGSCDRVASPTPPNNNAYIIRRIIDIIDGDTIILNGGERVRLVGVNTPEMNSGGSPEPCAVEAKSFTHSRANNRDCYLVYNTSVGDSLDYYHRTLAFVHILPDSSCLNIEIVRNGWSEFYDNYPVRADYAARLASAETAAANAGLGIWNPSVNCSGK